MNNRQTIGLWKAVWGTHQTEGGRQFAVVLALIVALAVTGRAEDWPQFRGASRDNVSKEVGLLRQWPAGGPKVLWTVPLGQGYAGAAIVGGRIYHNDYDEQKSEWGVYARSLADGKELWRFREARVIRPNHAITRTVPAVDGKYVFSLDPKLVLHCLDVKTGKQVWFKNLVAEYKTTIPPGTTARTRSWKPTGSSSRPAAPRSWWRSTRRPARKSGARRIPEGSCSRTRP